MTSIAVLGSGSVARALATGFRAAAHEVAVGSRAPERAAPGWAGSGVRVTTLADAAARAEVVVNALPGPVAPEVLQGLAAELSGKVLVDVANATLPDPDGLAAELLFPGRSLAEEIQRALPDVRVVKTLNTMHVSLMADPAAAGVPPTAFLSGADAEAKRVVVALLADLGWRRSWLVDLGGVESARGPEAFLLMVGGIVRTLGPVPFGLAVAR